MDNTLLGVMPPPDSQALCGQDPGCVLYVDVIMRSAKWQDLGAIEDMLMHVVQLARSRISPVQQQNEEVALVLSDDEEITQLNARYRNIDKATNVLSFPHGANSAPHVPNVCLLGDIVLSYDTIMKEASMQDKDALHHICHLVVHGLLHLLGYDHIEEEEALSMESLETQILAELGIGDPYSDDQNSGSERP